MTISGLAAMLATLGFDTDEIPARRGPITLAELEYDEIDNYWHFRFRWDDIEIPVATKNLPAELWDAIADDASPGESNTMIFGRSASSNWDGETPMIEILGGLRDELVAFAQKMERLQALIAPLLPESATPSEAAAPDPEDDAELSVIADLVERAEAERYG